MRRLLLAILFCVPAFALPDLRGRDLVSGSAVHWKPGVKTSVVVFLSPTCPCSRSHEGALREMRARFPQFDFVGVVSNADEKAAREHFTASALGFPVLSEAGHAWADAFSALNTPHAFVVGASGEVEFEGGVDDSRNAQRAREAYLNAALTALAEGRPVEKRRARPLGCAIRR